MITVQAGAAKGKKLKTPSGLRPTSALVRKALFDIIGPLEDLSFLDLFAGSGTVGIEALSRGAVRAVFIESHPRSARIISENLRSTGLLPRGSVLSGRLPKVLGRLGGSFNLVFMDPPYGDEETVPTLQALSWNGILQEGSRVIVEHSRRLALPDHIGVLARDKQKIYGDSSLSIYHQTRPKGGDTHDRGGLSG
ncbi:MAG: 16S rRNA (guanine(966)-N(2))-methyltransferase RsmD [Firmicutes bacterium]|nr:16S rRNA (guanine(966)-N(2))-methyltransferase RsmD [Bacillota bacterium]